MDDQHYRHKASSKRKSKLRFRSEPRRRARRSSNSRSPRSYCAAARDPSAIDDAARHRTRGVDTLDPDDEAFYTSAAYETEPSLASNYEIDDFKERLFDAMADEEGRDYWRSVYSQPIHDIDPPQDAMTDDEYAAYVRRGMWERIHARDADSRRWSARDINEKNGATKPGSTFQRSAVRHSHESAMLNETLTKRWKDYLKDWGNLGEKRWTTDVVPWPTLSGRHEEVTLESIVQFLSFAGSVVPVAKEELRRRWHPDRFQQRALKHVVESDQATTVKLVTLVAQLLNTIISRE